jgi:hypothetical protein
MYAEITFELGINLPNDLKRDLSDCMNEIGKKDEAIGNTVFQGRPSNDHVVFWQMNQRYVILVYSSAKRNLKAHIENIYVKDNIRELKADIEEVITQFKGYLKTKKYKCLDTKIVIANDSGSYLFYGNSLALIERITKLIKDNISLEVFLPFGVFIISLLRSTPDISIVNTVIALSALIIWAFIFRIFNTQIVYEEA